MFNGFNFLIGATVVDDSHILLRQVPGHSAFKDISYIKTYGDNPYVYRRHLLKKSVLQIAIIKSLG